MSSSQHIITHILHLDPNSKLLMNSTGTKPLNPFPDERAYEDSLVMNFHPGTHFTFHDSTSCV